jgi:hypothetical protein
MEMRALEGAARELALHSFCGFVAGPGFLELPSEVLLLLVEDDALVSEEGEDAVLEAVLSWAGARPERAKEAARLLRAVRVRFVRPQYAERAMAGAPKGLREALAATSESESCGGLKAPAGKSAGAAAKGSAAQARKKRRTDAGAAQVPGGAVAAPVETTDNGPGGGQEVVHSVVQRPGGVFTREERVVAGSMVYTLAASGGDLFAAVEGGGIQVWDMATLRLKNTLDGGHSDTVRAMVVHAGWLISGGDGVCVWDVGTCELLARLSCCGGMCRALALCGDILATGHVSFERGYGYHGVNFWRMCGEPKAWVKLAHTAQDSDGKKVHCLAAVGGGLVAAGREDAVYVYDVETGRKVAGPLSGYQYSSTTTSAVTALAVAGRVLYGASRDCPVLAHSIDTWEQVGKAKYVRSHDETVQNERSLLPLGQVLVTGASGPRYSATARYEVRVLDARTLQLLDVLPQGPGENILSLIAARGCVWGAAGDKLVVWRQCAWGDSDVPHAEFVSWGARRHQV